MADKATITKQPDGTITLTISIPKEDVAKAREDAINKAQEQAELPGFRKGKAPRETVEQNINPQVLQEEILKVLLPKAYVKAIEENQLRPIMNPKIKVQAIKQGEDWVFEAVTCEMPEVKLGDYKDKVQSITAKAKIVIPGQDKKPEVNADEIVRAVAEATTVQIPLILLQQEADKHLAQTLDEVKKLGLTLDQFLQSTGKTPEALRKEYEEKARRDMTLEFALQKVAETEKITVENTEIDEAIQKAKDPREKEHLEKNRYLLASILRQQKTLDFLKNL